MEPSEWRVGGWGEGYSYTHLRKHTHTHIRRSASLTKRAQSRLKSASAPFPPPRLDAFSTRFFFSLLLPATTLRSKQNKTKTKTKNPHSNSANSSPKCVLQLSVVSGNPPVLIPVQACIIYLSDGRFHLLACGAACVCYQPPAAPAVGSSLH